MTETKRRPGRPKGTHPPKVYTERLDFYVTPAMKEYILGQPDGAGKYLRNLVLRDVDASLDVALDSGADAEPMRRRS
jgi:hypothetical protein